MTGLIAHAPPDGIAGKSFFRRTPGVRPAWVRTGASIRRTRGDIDYFVVDDAASLRYVANSGSIPLHLWASRLASLERPDWLVLDLDPKGAPFTDVVKVAQALHRILDDLELPSYPKTSGATGLHILIPLGARYTYDEVRTFARLLAVLGVEAEPDISTIAGARNGAERSASTSARTATADHRGAVLLRPLPGAPASCRSRGAGDGPPRPRALLHTPKRFDR